MTSTHHDRVGEPRIGIDTKALRMRRLHHPLWSDATLVAGLLGAFLAVVPTARAATPSYVALGDSYAAGTGTRTYLADGTTCQRSVYAYPALLASAKG